MGSHDMILDCTTGPRGNISAEVKLRRVRDQVHLEKVWKLARKDCNTVWDAAVSETPGVYGGQLLLLYSFPVVGDTWVSRADFRNAGGSWSPLWGWGAPKNAAPNGYGSAPPCLEQTSRLKHARPHLVSGLL